MELNTDTLQSLAIGATGGVPLTVLLLSTMKSLRESFDMFRDQAQKQLETVSSRLQKLEVVFEVTYKNEIQHLKDRIARLEEQGKE